MKLKATKKEIREGYKHILSVNYCSMQHLLNYYSPFAYSTRVEGWACDYYEINGICICTGYSPIKEKNCMLDYELIREYDKKAIGKTKEEIDILLSELITKLTKD